MGLWRDINNPRMGDLVGRASMREGSAAYEAPVSTGLVSDHSHTSHTTASPLSEDVTIRTGAAHSCTWCRATPLGVLHMESKDGRL